MGGARSTRGTDWKFIKNLVWKPEGRWPLGRPRHRWKDIIRIYLTEM